MPCIYDEPNEPYICEADWNCKDCPNWVEDKGARNMGMTIEEAKEHLSQYIGDNRVDYDDLDAIGVAIDTMRKYQKIREIVFPLQFCSTDKLEHEAIMKICEVLEDEKTD